MFWVLLGLAAVGFVPCIILPVWRDYQWTAAAAQVEEQRIAAMEAHVQRQRHTAEALGSDPGAATRAAQRELAYRRPGQEQVAIPGVPVVYATPTPEALVPVEPPVSIARLLGHLPAADYDALFCEGPTRTLIMAMCGGLLVAAFVLYSPSGRRRETDGPPPGQA
ncbi:MAG: hypothetical protein GY778_15385 [bacterium]|nr:hypothetical protein [bacterium]